jgi:hypothetical protein
MWGADTACGPALAIAAHAPTSKEATYEQGTQSPAAVGNNGLISSESILDVCLSSLMPGIESGLAPAIAVHASSSKDATYEQGTQSPAAVYAEN